MSIPTKPGFYWAKWRICDEGTYEGQEAEFSPSDEWETVRVCINGGLSKGDDDYLRVEVGGVAHWQSLVNFVWGDPIPLVSPKGQQTALLKFLLDNRGECIGDHPAWVRQIEAALGITPTIDGKEAAAREAMSISEEAAIAAEFMERAAQLRSAVIWQSNASNEIWHYVERPGKQFLLRWNDVWFDTLEEAQAAAQADFEQRILSALQPSSEPATADKPETFQHRIYYEDTKEWSDWAPGQRPPFPLGNPVETRALYLAPPPLSGRGEGLEEADWIDWDGGAQPVPNGTRVDFKVFPDHVFLGRLAEAWSWGEVRRPANPAYGSIIAYRAAIRQTKGGSNGE